MKLQLYNIKFFHCFEGIHRYLMITVIAICFFLNCLIHNSYILIFIKKYKWQRL